MLPTAREQLRRDGESERGQWERRGVLEEEGNIKKERERECFKRKGEEILGEEEEGNDRRTRGQ